MDQPDVSQRELNRAAQVLMHAFDHTGRIETSAIIEVLRAAKLDSALILSVKGQVIVKPGVLAAFRKLAGHGAVWDAGQDCWRARRKDDPA